MQEFSSQSQGPVCGGGGGESVGVVAGGGGSRTAEGSKSHPIATTSLESITGVG